MTQFKDIDTKEKLELILEGLKERKAKEIVSIDLQKIENAICDYFVVCHGDSSTQVDALADGVQKKLRKEKKINVHHIEGTDQCQWVLMDYTDILVHIFQREQREFYKLEELWADGELEKIEDEM